MRTSRGRSRREAALLRRLRKAAFRPPNVEHSQRDRGERERRQDHVDAEPLVPKSAKILRMSATSHAQLMATNAGQ